MNHEDPPLGPFAQLYHEWLEANLDERDPSTEPRLAATYRDAWAAGDWHERLYVLYFAFDRHDPADADLFLAGMASDNSRLAQEAALRIWILRDKYGFDFGSDLRRSYRSLVRRFPDLDFTRPPEMYGHLDGDEDDRAQRPFVNLYEDWMADDHPRDPLILRQLTNTFRETWARGDGVDRAYVLHFINLARRPHHDTVDPVDARDLVIEALRTDDPVLAPAVGFSVWCHLDDGVDLGSDIRELLQAHLRRFPQLSGHAIYALQDLDKRERKAADADA
jgi:hypothetical protein